jgi:glycosyltransferase involved in cell wall biosynthesis
MASMKRAPQDIALAIVIPAWRSQFLGATLDSLRAQTDRRFRVYIGDDASPDDIAAVVARHGAELELVYHRFGENLGRRNLVAHWHRCVGLTRGEPWL